MLRVAFGVLSPLREQYNQVSLSLGEFGMMFVTRGSSIGPPPKPVSLSAGLLLCSQGRPHGSRECASGKMSGINRQLGS